jgi:hypothetical protein
LVESTTTARFWHVDEPEDQLWAEVQNGYEAERCPVELGRRRVTRIGDLVVRVDPRAVKGFTWSTEGVMLSPKVLQLFRRHGVTGFETRPVKVSFPEEIEIELPPPDLHELVVTGWGGLASPRAGVELVKWCPACGATKFSIADPSQLIDSGAWDGSDLFFVWPLPMYLFVTDRVADLLRQERVSGVELIPAPRIPTKSGATLSPGLLADYLPEQRARELEDRFGVSNWQKDICHSHFD